jgi:hypothetical protein
VPEELPIGPDEAVRYVEARERLDVEKLVDRWRKQRRPRA